jgi:hypothetical protein
LKEQLLDQDQETRKQPGMGYPAKAGERLCGWEGATPSALIPHGGRIPLPFDPRIRAPHTIETPTKDIKRNISRFVAPRFTARAEGNRELTITNALIPALPLVAPEPHEPVALLGLLEL